MSAAEFPQERVDPFGFGNEEWLSDKFGEFDALPGLQDPEDVLGVEDPRYVVDRLAVDGNPRVSRRDDRLQYFFVRRAERDEDGIRAGAP